MVTEESIVRNISGNDSIDGSYPENSIEDENTIIRPTSESAASAMTILRSFLEGQDDAAIPLQCLTGIEDYMTDLSCRTH